MNRVSTIAALAAICAACGDNASAPDARSAASGERYAVSAPTASVAKDAQSPSGAGASDNASTAQLPQADRKLIRTAQLRLQVRDVPAAITRADSIAKSRQALVADSRTRLDADGTRTADLVLRVPAAQLDELLRTLRAIGDVESESVSAQDVTKEYTDLATRLAVKEQTVARLRALLDNRVAKLSDVLEVERELDRAVAELEVMKGEQRYYDQQIALSTVTLTLFERAPSQIDQITRPIGDALHRAMQVLGRSVGAIIYLAVALVPWALVALGIAWIWRVVRRRFLSSSDKGPPII
jgi:hypothetical protein